MMTRKDDRHYNFVLTVLATYAIILYCVAFGCVYAYKYYWLGGAAW